ncbi:hypothetical protein [Rhizobium gallicum]|nr:hypothetical protein [Rhizobium gallicum]
MVTEINLRRTRNLLKFRLSLAEIVGDFLSPPDFPRAISSFCEQRKRNAALAQDFTLEKFARIAHDVQMTVAEQITNPYLAQTWVDTYYLGTRIWLFCLPIGEEKLSPLQGQEIGQLIQAFSTGRPSAISDVLNETMRQGIDQILRIVGTESKENEEDSSLPISQRRPNSAPPSPSLRPDLPRHRMPVSR